MKLLLILTISLGLVACGNQTGELKPGSYASVLNGEFEGCEGVVGPIAEAGWTTLTMSNCYNYSGGTELNIHINNLEEI